MHKKIIYLLFVLASGLMACQNQSEKAPAETVAEFLAAYKSDFRTANRIFFSKGLSEIIEKTIAREKEEIQKTKASAYPNSKPMILEGDVFTALHEGQDAFTIADTDINGDTAKVWVNCRNSVFKIEWKDQVILVKENGWKIDDVKFGTYKQDLGGTRGELLRFLNAPRVEL